MKFALSAAALCLLFACRQTAPQQDWGSANTPIVPAATYTKADIQKMSWLIGAWQSDDEQAMQETIHMVNDSTLEFKQYAGAAEGNSVQLQWHEGRFYYGKDWVVSWIGRKTIRLEPLRPNLPALTWTRRNDNGWFVIRHDSEVPKQVLMQRAEHLGEVHYP